jgi:hypothetical protein
VKSYYDIGAANERVAQLRPLLLSLKADRDAIAAARLRLDDLRAPDGRPQADDGNRHAENGNGHADDGSRQADDGSRQAEFERVQQEVMAVVQRMEAAVRQIDDWGVTLRDIRSGLVDFPALVSGRPIWLCWKLGERDIGWWHDLEAGMAGRKPLIDLE